MQARRLCSVLVGVAITLSVVACGAEESGISNGTLTSGVAIPQVDTHLLQACTQDGRWEIKEGSVTFDVNRGALLAIDYVAETPDFPVESENSEPHNSECSFTWEVITQEQADSGRQ